MKTAYNSEAVFTKLFTPRYIALGFLAGILLLLGLTGCQSSVRESGADDSLPAGWAGDYTLMSVDGNVVPCIVRHEDQDITVKSGDMNFSTNGTCASRSVFAVKGYKEVNRVVEATYTVSGAELTMRWKRAGMTRGSFNGNTFTMNNEGMIFVYQKSN